VASLAEENIFEGLTRTDRSGRSFSGRSKQRPYGILVWQYASGSKKREQAPALHRNVATLNWEIGGKENQKSRREGSACGWLRREAEWALGSQICGG
jgi:hypothetical protein